MTPSLSVEAHRLGKSSDAGADDDNDWLPRFVSFRCVGGVFQRIIEIRSRATVRHIRCAPAACPEMS